MRLIPKEWIHVGAALVFVASAVPSAPETTGAVITGLAMTTGAVATRFVCFKTCALDHVAKVAPGRFATSRLFLQRPRLDGRSGHGLFSERLVAL